MFTYLFDGFLRRVFSLLRAGGFIYIALAWRHKVLLVQGSFRFFTWSLAWDSPPSVHDDISLQNSSSPGAWHETPFTVTSVPKLIFLFPISAYEKVGYFCFRILANHLASIFFLPLSGNSLGLLSLSPGHRMQTSVGFHSDLDLLLRPWGIDLYYYSSF